MFLSVIEVCFKKKKIIFNGFYFENKCWENFINYSVDFETIVKNVKEISSCFCVNIGNNY